MPSRWCQCSGCPHCGNGHNQLYTITEQASGHRCEPCQAHATKARQARRSSSRRGLGWAFSRRKAGNPAYQAATRCQCQGCPQHFGPCGQPFTRDNPKTAGHTVPRSKGGHNSPIKAICRRCNSSDGGTLAHTR